MKFLVEAKFGQRNLTNFFYLFKRSKFVISKIFFGEDPFYKGFEKRKIVNRVIQNCFKDGHKMWLAFKENRHEHS